MTLRRWTQFSDRELLEARREIARLFKQAVDQVTGAWVWCGQCEGRGSLDIGYWQQDCPMCKGQGGWHEDVKR